MEISKSTSITTNMSVILTNDDIKELIRNKFNLSTHTPILIDYSNTINNQIKISWTEYSNGS